MKVVWCQILAHKKAAILSCSRLFSTFLQIFFGVVVYGLFHGLVFLPVLLSLVGPPSYAGQMESHPAETEEMCPSPQCLSPDPEGKIMGNLEEKGNVTEPRETDDPTGFKKIDLNGCTENGKLANNKADLSDFDVCEKSLEDVDLVLEKNLENTKL